MPTFRAPGLTRLSGLILLLISWFVTRGVLLADSFSGSIPLDVVAYSKWANELVAGASPALDTAFVLSARKFPGVPGPKFSARGLLLPRFHPARCFHGPFNLDQFVGLRSQIT